MQSRQLTCNIVSVGAWGSYFENWAALQQLLQGGALPETRMKGPKPAVIPANERRRAPLPVRLAVESSLQATTAAAISPDTLSCVFVSGLGDTDLTDYMCKTLASEHKELSPTKFHNSVHNAPVGYWTISTNTLCAANSVTGFEQSVSLALLEAMVQCESEEIPMLVTFYDAPVSPILQPLLFNQEAFAFSLILYPMSQSREGALICANVESHENVENNENTDWPPLYTENNYIASLYDTNPSARILCLAELLNENKQVNAEKSICMPLSKGSSISFKII